MNTAFQKTVASDEWYTPRDLVEALGEFDLDPCAPMVPLWRTAREMVNKEQDGLSIDWGGVRVWLNPPYSRPLIERFIEKMVENGNGIALLYNRLDNKMCVEKILPNASAILFLRHRVRFYLPDGTRGGSPGHGSMLVAFGESNAEILRNCRVEGFFVSLKDSKTIKL